MATRLAMAKSRAESIEATNTAVRNITDQINAFVGEDDKLFAFELALQMPKSGDPFLRESQQIATISDFMTAVNIRLTMIAARIKDQEELIDSLLETKSELLEDNSKLTDRIAELENQPATVVSEAAEPPKVETATTAKASAKAKNK